MPTLSLKKQLRKLEKSGMTILVRSADPFINDESIAELFEASRTDISEL